MKNNIFKTSGHGEFPKQYNTFIKLTWNKMTNLTILKLQILQKKKETETKNISHILVKAIYILHIWQMIMFKIYKDALKWLKIHKQSN